MKQKKTKVGLIVFLTSLITIIILVALYALNNNYDWVNLNGKEDNKNIKKDTTTVNLEKKLTNLTFNNKAYIEEIIDNDGSIDITRTLTATENSTKVTYMTKFNTLYIDLKSIVDDEVESLLSKQTISVTDINNFKKFLIKEASDYNTAVAKLSSAEFDLYTIIVNSMPLLDYYYIDGIDGTYLIDVNYAYLYNVFKYKLSTAGREYCILKANIYKYNNGNYLYKSFGLGISWQQLEEILLKYDKYIAKYPNEDVVQNEFNTLFNIYIGDFVLDNTPIYESDGVTVITDVLETYKDIIDNHTDFSGYNQIKAKYDASN